MGAKKVAKKTAAEKAKKGLKKKLPPSDHPSKTFWKVLAYASAVTFLATIVVLALYIVFIRKTIYYRDNDPTKELKSKMASTLGKPEIQNISVGNVSTELLSLRNDIMSTEAIFEEKKAGYRKVVNTNSLRRAAAFWQFYGRSFYYISKGKKTWHGADNFCVSRDSHLASILNNEEQNYIISQLNQPAWIGLSDERKEGTWEWSDSSSVTTRYWADGEPSNSKKEKVEEDCVVIESSTTGHNWNDADCYALNGWVCKWSLDNDGL